MVETYRLFVSRSFDKRDKPLIESVLRFCRAAGFEPIKTERASTNLPREKIREAIRDAQAFLGILTKVDDDSEDTGDWVKTEIGMADFAGLPIILFIEEGIKFNPGDHITSYTHFDRDNREELNSQVVEALVELRENQRSTLGNQPLPGDDPYKVLIDDVAITIGDDGTMCWERHVEIESQIGALRALQPMTKIITSSRALGYHDSTLEFVPGTRSGTAALEIRHNDPTEVSYQVGFEEPLGKNERADFTVVHRSRGSLPLSHEDLVHAKNQRYSNIGDVARQGHAVKTTTDRLILTLRFPDGYPIQDCAPRVNVTLRDRVGDSTTAEAECERAAIGFRIRYNRLELEIENARVGYAYYFEWTPPAGGVLPPGLRNTLGSG